MKAFAEKDILDLSVPERIQLAQDIWDSVALVPESLLLSEEEKAEIDRQASKFWSDLTERGIQDVPNSILFVVTNAPDLDRIQVREILKNEGFSDLA
jgi:putative addiction module component (TIGR02574 family)